MQFLLGTTLKNKYYLSGVLCPVPLKINKGLMQGSPSANMVGCTVHWLLSWPSPVVWVHTDFSPFSAQVAPLVLNQNGRGVWSILAISLNSQGPTMPCWIPFSSVALTVAVLLRYLWNCWIEVHSVSDWQAIAGKGNQDELLCIWPKQGCAWRCMSSRRRHRDSLRLWNWRQERT